MAEQGTREYLVYIGTYTTGESEGIYIYRLDMSTGALRFSDVVSDIDNPSFLDLHPSGRYLYAISEVSGADGGFASAFSVNAVTGGLTFLNRQPTRGNGPCYVNVETGRYVLVANYGGGSVTVFPVKEDGSLGEAADFVQHSGSSINPNRQEGPHAHSVLPDPTGRWVFAADLGLDKIMIYRLEPNSGKLTPNKVPWTRVKAGAGPRHLAFHPNGRFAYVINELDNTITGFTYDADRGVFDHLQTVPALPPGFQGISHCADIHVHPSGRFVYGSNRGHDSLVTYQVNNDTGRLSKGRHTSTRGRNPRNFALDPDGELLLVANQDSRSVLTFWLDQENGMLEPTGHVAEVPDPVCIELLPADRRLTGSQC